MILYKRQVVEEVFENVWGRAIDVDKRGRHATFAKAITAALEGLTVEKNEFFDSLVDNWKRLFPDLPARPGRYEAGRIFIYVANSVLLYSVRPKLRAIKARLATLPGAPKKIELRLEVRSSK